MRKQLAALLLGTVLVLGTTAAAMAEGSLTFDEITASKAGEDEGSEEAGSAARKSIFDSGSTDVVTIEDGKYTVVSEYATTTIIPAFGWICLTQDLSQQLNDFSQVFEDPRSIVEESMIPDGEHYILTDTGLNILVLHSQNVDPYSKLIVNSAGISPEDDEDIIDALLESSFTDYRSATLEAGGHHWFCFLSPDGTHAFYETVVDGVNYDFDIYSWDEDDTPLTDTTLTEIEEMLGTLVIISN